MSFGFAVQHRHRAVLPTSYAEARERFERFSKRSTGRIAHNTYLLSDDPDEFVVRLHRTDVVTFLADGSIRLDSGGWQSSTTRDRIRRCGVRIGVHQGIADVDHRGRSWTFADGMVLHADGGVSYPDRGHVNPDPDVARKLRRRNLRRGTAHYCESRQSSRWQGGNAPEAFERVGVAA